MNWTDVLGSVGSVLGPLGSIAGGIFSNIFNKDSNNASLAEQQREFDTSLNWAQKSFYDQLEYNKWALGQQYSSNSMLQQQSQQWNEKMWNMANEYNKPVNQMSRFREAGLNPYIMMGNSGSVGSGNASTQSMGSSSVGLSSAPSAMSPSGHGASFLPYNNPVAPGIFSTLADNLFQLSMRESAAKKQNSEAQNMDIQNKTEYARALASIELMKAETKSSEARSALDRIITSLKKSTFSYDVDKAMWDTANAQDQNALIVSQTASTDVGTAIQKKQLKWIDPRARAELNLTAANAFAANAAGNKSYAEARLAAANAIIAGNSPFAQMSPQQAKKYASYVCDKNRYEALKTLNEVNNVHWGNLSLQRTIRQQDADYDNRYWKYIGQVFSGSGSANYSSSKPRKLK